jgi:aspartate/methionine/tyrosine aminotransferase
VWFPVLHSLHLHPMPPVSQRILRTDSAVIDQLQERYVDVPNLINLAPGSPAFRPSTAVIAATTSSLAETSICTYGDVVGWTPLRRRWMQVILNSWDAGALQSEALSAGLSASDDYGLELMITAGANQGFVNLILALCDPGDEVILLLPYYFSHYCALLLADVTPVIVPCEPSTLLPASSHTIQAAMTSKTRAVVLVSPGNPSGVVMPACFVDELVSICRKGDVWLIMDEAYKELTGDAPHYSPPQLTGVIKLYTMSKIYGMAGWRVGALLYPRHLSNQLRKVQDTIPTHATMISQIAAHHALEIDGPLLAARAQLNFDKRSRFALVLSEVYSRAQGKLCHPFVVGNGALYFFLPIAVKPGSCKSMRHADRDVVDVFVQKGNVLVTPGQAFGMPEYVRVSFGSIQCDKVDAAIDGLRKALEFWFEL